MKVDAPAGFIDEFHHSIRSDGCHTSLEDLGS
jgi:hypothetical protein